MCWTLEGYSLNVFLVVVHIFAYQPQEGRRFLYMFFAPAIIFSLITAVVFFLVNTHICCGHGESCKVITNNAT